MLKKEFVKEIATRTDLTMKDSELALDAITLIIAESIQKKEEVSLVGVGTFKTVLRAKKAGVNPKTKEKIDIPAKIAPMFKFSGTLRKEVAKNSIN